MAYRVSHRIGYNRDNPHCARCKQHKPKAAFRKRTFRTLTWGNTTGRSYWCKQCECEADSINYWTKRRTAKGPKYPNRVQKGWNLLGQGSKSKR